MLSAWLALALFGLFVAGLLAVVRFAEAAPSGDRRFIRHPLVYALAVGACCGSWGAFNSIGMASRRGVDFLPTYIGPILLFALFHPLVTRMVRLAAAQRLTSIADFVSARYGRTALIGVAIGAILTLGSIPFVASQLATIARCLVIVGGGVASDASGARVPILLASAIAIVVAALCLAVGPRGPSIAGRPRSLLLAVAAGSFVQLAAFLGVGIWVCWGLFDGLGDLTRRVIESPKVAAVIDASPTPSHWIAMVVFSFAAALVTPRSFQVAVAGEVEETEVQAASWLVPAYVIVLILMVLPIAAAGLVAFPAAEFDRDITVFALPIQAHASGITALALLGAVGAATAVALASVTAGASILTNDLMVPLILAGRRRGWLAARDRPPVLLYRRLAIVAIVAAAWLTTIAVPSRTLASLVLVFLAAVVQIAPAAIGGLVWESGTARGALAGCIAGILVWAYTLLLPFISTATSPLIVSGPLGLDALRPTDLFQLDVAPFDQAIFWSLAINLATYVVLSLSRGANPNERLQAGYYVRGRPMSLAPSLRLESAGVATGEVLSATASWIGDRGATTAFRDYHAAHDIELNPTRAADVQLLRFAETLVGATIGAASSRTVISQLLERHEGKSRAARRIVDDVALEVQNGRDILQHAIDLAREGMAVFDRDLRLVAWNRAYRDMFKLPSDLMRIGIPLDTLVRSNAERGIYGPGLVEDLIAMRLEALTRQTEKLRLHSAVVGRIYEMHSVRLDNGGIFFTYVDATAQVKSEKELEAENVTLEQRVRERTEELEALNFELARAKAEAEDANISKTRFLAAASHDLLQPLNAARLYATSLRERLRVGQNGEDLESVAQNVDDSLEAVEDILGALLEISHLDGGAIKTEISSFAIEGILRQLQIEFQPLARGRGLRLRITRSSAWVTSDRRLLSRLLQNLVSNAIKYTMEGGVLVGVRRAGTNLRIDVHDTGLGIPESKRGLIFREFERLPAAARVANGVGLGLSIVERVARVLRHDIAVHSILDQGSTFSIILPRAEPSLVGAPTSVQPGIVQRPRSLEGLAVAAIDNERDILNGMEVLLDGWDCVVATGTGLTEIQAALTARALAPDVILADYHIDDETDGLAVIAILRARFGPCPAVLITADRSPAIRKLAQAADVRVLNKPLKPAALRALLSQWRLVKTAAE